MSPADNAAGARALRDAGKSADEIAELFGVHPATVYRWLADEPSEPVGPTERVARSLVAKWGALDEAKAVTAETLIGLAVIADVGRSRQAKGIDRQAAVSAFKDLRVMLADLGETSDAEALIKALRDGG